MNTKKIARICGWLYLSTVLAFVLSNLILKGRLVDVEDISSTFKLISANAFQYRLSVSIDFLAMVAVMGLVFSLFAILKPIHPYFALVALGLRIGEVVIQAGGKIPDYLLLQLSQTAVAYSGDSSAGFESLGKMLIAGSTQALWVSFVFLSIGSIFNNYLFYISKMIPVGIAVFGLISAGLYTVGAMTALIVDLPESAKMGMMLPMVLFELSLGGYLAFFGVKERFPTREIGGA